MAQAELTLCSTHNITYNDDGSATISIELYTMWDDSPMHHAGRHIIHVRANAERYDWEGSCP